MTYDKATSADFIWIYYVHVYFIVPSNKNKNIITSEFNGKIIQNALFKMQSNDGQNDLWVSLLLASDYVI